jgi:hypothetical protein
MSKPVNDMEGGFRLDRVRRIRNWLYSAQLMMIVVFVIALMYTSGDFSIYPFHLGVPSFLYFVFLMIIVISVESVIFVQLESRFLKSPSSKYYLLKKAMRRYVVIIITMAIIGVIFFLPAVNTVVKDISQTDKEYTVTSSSMPVAIEFYSSDFVGMTNMNFISVSTDGDEVWVFIVSEEDYNAYKDLGSTVLASYRINSDVYEAYPGMEYSVPDLQYGKYYICLYSPNDISVTTTVVTNHDMSAQLIGYVPFFCLILIVLNIVWVLYLRPLKRLFEQRAIYR